MKRMFDTIIIFDIGLDDAALDQKLQKVEGIIKASEGEIIKQEKWGKRKLTYEIKKKNEGNFTYFLHNSEPGVVDQMQNMFHFDESVLKSLTIQVDQVRRSRYNRKKNKKKDKPAAQAVATGTTITPTEEGETNG